MQRARVLPAVGGGQHPLEHRAGFGRCRSGGGLAGAGVPQGPRRQVHQRICEQHRRVGVVAMRPVHLAHRVGVAGVPRREVRGRPVCWPVGRHLRLGKAVRKSGDERTLNRRRLCGRACSRECHLRSVSRRLLLGSVEHLPGLVVVRPECVGNAPVRHRAAGVGPDRPLETAHCLGVVEAVRPDEPATEPGLRLLRLRRHRPLVTAEVIPVARGRRGGPGEVGHQLSPVVARLSGARLSSHNGQG